MAFGEVISRHQALFERHFVKRVLCLSKKVFVFNMSGRFHVIVWYALCAGKMQCASLQQLEYNVSKH